MIFWKKKWPEFVTPQFKKKLKKILGYKPSNPGLYSRAFLHSSYANNTESYYKNHNERLEFLGDLILDASVGSFLFETFPYISEGELTNYKMKFVNRATLNKLAHRMGLDALIIGKFNYDKIPDDVLGNTLEALIGAIYLDKGFKFTQKIIISRFFDKHINILNLINSEEDYKSKLMLWAQKSKKRVTFKHSRRINKYGEVICFAELFIDDELFCQGEGGSKKNAEQEASRLTCEKLNL